MNFTLKAENFIYTKCGILETLKKPGLVKETLGKLSNLTGDCICHQSTPAIYLNYSGIIYFYHIRDLFNNHLKILIVFRPLFLARYRALSAREIKFSTVSFLSVIKVGETPILTEMDIV